jgi:hypothetical protein
MDAASTPGWTDQIQKPPADRFAGGGTAPGSARLPGSEGRDRVFVAAGTAGPNPRISVNGLPRPFSK